MTPAMVSVNPLDCRFVDRGQGDANNLAQTLLWVQRRQLPMI